MILVGTRADKARERQVSTSEGAAFAAKLGAAFKEVVGVKVAEADGVIADVVNLLVRFLEPNRGVSSCLLMVVLPASRQSPPL